MEYTLSLGKVYAECVTCEKVFVVDQYADAGFCNYDYSTLVKIGQTYSRNGIWAGLRLKDIYEVVYDLPKNFPKIFRLFGMLS